MTPERWKQVDELAQAALERAGNDRAAFLDQACAGDDTLRREVESQIAYQQQASKFLEEPAFKQHMGAQASLPAFLIAGSQTETESMEGRTISHYSILRKLGSGGMGEVYLAQDTTLSRKVAIKFLSQNSVAGEQAKKRLVREAKAAAALDHHHICAVYEVGEEAGYSFIVMQYVEGETLASRIQRQPIESRESLDIAVQIADALAEAHFHRIIHRDVKPQNVMLTASGQVKVLDFGLARVVREGSLIDSISETESLLSVPGAVIGTVPYMSPEQVRGEALDGRSDIFSFGAVLYEMLSGRNPFQADSVGATMSSILTKEPPPLARFASDIPDELQRIVRKALSKNKEGRYQGIKDLLIDLRELKQELEFEAKLEGSTGPESRDRSTTPERAETGQRSETETQQTVGTGELFTTRTTSSTRVVIGEIKRHKLGASLTLAAIVVAAVVAYFYYHRQPILTDKDTILLTDFTNTTGDAVFDSALKQALAIQLEQSPFLNIFSDQRVREALRLMNHSPDDRVTKDVAREICQRQELKAYLAGSIANLGSHFVITLEAVNAQTGDTLARQQVEAESKEQVLGTLGQAATKLREKLGESLASIQKYDAPLEQVTTSSLEALKAFSQAKEQNYKGKDAESIPFFKLAIELDSNFARAYNALAIAYNNLGQEELWFEAAQKAFELRDRTSEYEKLKIASDYYLLVTNEIEKSVEVQELLTRTYPRDVTAHTNLAGRYNLIGRYEQAAEEARAAIRLYPNGVYSYGNLADALRCLNRFDEAKEVYGQALAQKLDRPFYHSALYDIAFVQGDTAAMQRELDGMKGKPKEEDALAWQANTASFLGQMRKARELNQRLLETQLGRNLKEGTAQNVSLTALRAAYTGNCQQAQEDAARASALPRTIISSFRINIALALCGDLNRAQSLADEYAKRFPKSTWMNSVWLPTLRAALEMRRDNPTGAIQTLQSAKPYEQGFGSLPSAYLPQYFRGQAYLAQGAGAEAAAEFQKILDHRGLAPTSALYPLAHLGLARAAVVVGDMAKARKVYQDFFALWKDADSDLPILIEAKKEYAALK